MDFTVLFLKHRFRIEETMKSLFVYVLYNAIPVIHSPGNDLLKNVTVVHCIWHILWLNKRSPTICLKMQNKKDKDQMISYQFGKNILRKEL